MRLRIKRSQSLQGSAWDIDKTQLQYSTGKLESGMYDNELSFMQSLPFPTVYARQAKLAEELVSVSRINLSQRQREIVRDIRLNYYGSVYTLSRLHLLNYQDSLYTQFLKAAELRLKTGETNLLEKVTAETQLAEVENNVFQAKTDWEAFQARLQALLVTDSLVATADSTLNKLPLPVATSQLAEQNPELQLAQRQVAVREVETKLEQAKLLPDLKLGYTNRAIGGNHRESGIAEVEPTQELMVGVGIPLWAKPQKKRIEASKIQAQIARQNLQYLRSDLEAQVEVARQQALKFLSGVEYYERTALPQAQLIITQASKAYRAGEINYQEYILNLNRALAIRVNYLDTLYNYDQAVIELQFITENQQ